VIGAILWVGGAVAGVWALERWRKKNAELTGRRARRKRSGR
jgi:hypothetical protein